MKITKVLATSFLIGGFAGCAFSDITPATSPGHELRPLVAGGNQYFVLNWQAAELKGRPAVTGTLTNQYGATADRVQLLVEALDDNGNVISQKVVWLGDNIAPFDRAYFAIPVEKSPKYRVSVFAYDWRGRTGP